jgi:hypothetical protein
VNSYKSKREFLDIGEYVSEDTEQMRQQILAMDELFLSIEHDTNKEEDELWAQTS